MPCGAVLSKPSPVRFVEFCGELGIMVPYLSHCAFNIHDACLIIVHATWLASSCCSSWYSCFSSYSFIALVNTPFWTYSYQVKLLRKLLTQIIISINSEPWYNQTSLELTNTDGYHFRHESVNGESAYVCLWFVSWSAVRKECQLSHILSLLITRNHSIRLRKVYVQIDSIDDYVRCTFVSDLPALVYSDQGHDTPQPMNVWDTNHRSGLINDAHGN